MDEFRAINLAVGLSPTVGSLSLYQIIPLLGMAMGIYYLKIWLNFSGLLAAILLGFSSGIFLAVLGDKPWLFLSRIKKVPYLVRSGAYYYPLLKSRNKLAQIKK